MTKKSPLRIAVFVEQFPVISETFVLNQITGLIDAGHELDIFTLTKRKPDITKVHADFKKYDLAKRVYCPPMYKNYFTLFIKLLGLLLRHGYMDPPAALSYLNIFNYKKGKEVIRSAFQTLPLLGKTPYDIIHCQFGTDALRFLSYRSSKFFQGKVVVSFRGYDISKVLKEKGDNCYDEIFKGADLCLPNCEYFRERLIKLGCDEKKIRVYHSGIDCSRFAFSVPEPITEGKIRITCIGRLVKKKGIEFCIRGFAKVAQVKEGISLNIVGEGPLREELSKLIVELKMESKIHLLGAKTQEEIIYLLNKSHIAIASSVTASNGDQDGPVNTLKEAMAMGLQVIGTRHGGIQELIEDGVSGFLVPERDADAVAEKLITLIDNPQLWPRMAKKGRARIEQDFDLKKLNKELLKIYDGVINREK